MTPLLERAWREVLALHSQGCLGLDTSPSGVLRFVALSPEQASTARRPLNPLDWCRALVRAPHRHSPARIYFDVHDGALPTRVNLCDCIPEPAPDVPL